MKDISISVVIPSYDEMANLQKGVLGKVKDFLEAKKLIYEVIIVDDGSKDGSIEFIKNYIRTHPTFSLIMNPHVGKAGSVTTGMISAKGKIILFTDMDQATPIEELDKILPYFKEKYDIVIGSRNTTRRGSPFIRQFISRANIFLRKIVIGLPDISDTQCGFKAFTKESAHILFPLIQDLHHGFKQISGSAVTAGFDVELLYIAKKMGYRIKEVPVNWLYVETRRVNPIRDSVNGVLDLLILKKNALQGIYEIRKNKKRRSTNE